MRNLIECRQNNGQEGKKGHYSPFLTDYPESMHGFQPVLWLVLTLENEILGKPAGGIIIELTRGVFHKIS